MGIQGFVQRLGWKRSFDENGGSHLKRERENQNVWFFFFLFFLVCLVLERPIGELNKYKWRNERVGLG